MSNTDHNKLHKFQTNFYFVQNTNVYIKNSLSRCTVRLQVKKLWP